MLQINKKSLHYKVSSFFWYWSLFRFESYGYSNNLCNHFWWVLSSWLMPIVSLFLIIMGAIFVSYFSIGLLIHSLYGIFLFAPVLMPDGSLMDGELPATAAQFFGYIGLVVQLFVWRIMWISWIEHKNGDSHFVPAVIREGFRGIKENYCPTITWKD